MPPMRTASLASRSSVLVALLVACRPEPPVMPAHAVHAHVPRKKKRPIRERLPLGEKPVVEAPPPLPEPEIEKLPTLPEPTTGEATETDPLRADATGLYISRLTTFLKWGFNCASVAPHEKRSCTPTAEVNIDSNGTVAGFTLTPCTSSPAINAAADATLREKVGQPLPPAPPMLPPLHSRALGIRFVCD